MDLKMVLRVSQMACEGESVTSLKVGSACQAYWSGQRWCMAIAEWKLRLFPVTSCQRCSTYGEQTCPTRWAVAIAAVPNGKEGSSTGLHSPPPHLGQCCSAPATYCVCSLQRPVDGQSALQIFSGESSARASPVGFAYNVPHNFSQGDYHTAWVDNQVRFFWSGCARPLQVKVWPQCIEICSNGIGRLL